MACKYKKTILAHEREAHIKFMEIINRHRNHLPPVIMHCFTGSKEEIKAYVDMGFFIGITGFLCKGTLDAICSYDDKNETKKGKWPPLFFGQNH